MRKARLTLIFVVLLALGQESSSKRSRSRPITKPKRRRRAEPQAHPHTRSRVSISRDDDPDQPIWSNFPPIGQDQDLQFTGRTKRHKSGRGDLGPNWNLRPFLVLPFDFNGNATSPLAFGRTLSSFSSVKDERTIEDVLSFAIKEGIFSSKHTRALVGKAVPLPSDPLGVCLNPERPPNSWWTRWDDEEDDAVSLRIWAARKLDLEIVDGQQCEANLVELAYRSYQSEPYDEQYTKRFWLKPQAGIIFYLLVEHQPSGSLHRLAISLDHERSDERSYFSMMQSTFQGSPFLDHVMTQEQDNHQQQQQQQQQSYILRLLTYNIWHNNPPTFLYPDPKDRWRRYAKRMRHLASIILEAQPHIIGFQEVRYDGYFGPIAYHSQLQHLVDLLNNDPSSLASNLQYQYIYQPAMAFQQGIDSHRLSKIREEEGLAIFSLYPIVNHDYLLLPQQFGDGDDEHRRICLHAEILVPHLGLIDVYVTHLSLSERMRETSANAILQYAKEGKGVAQFLLGDLNAEPHERSVQVLTGDAAVDLDDDEEEDASPRCSSRDHFQDVWLEFYDEPSPGSEDEWDRLEALTFPSCNPVKRIDYILWKNRYKKDEEEEKVHASAVRLLGQSATSDTIDQKSEGGGMLDLDSPVWASDHRALLADYLYQA